MIIKISYGNFEHNLDVKQVLGKGAFGSVHLVHDERGKPFAVKVSDCIDRRSNVIASQEIGILITLEHKNIAKMYAFDFNERQAILVMEYCNEGNLNSRLESYVSNELKEKWILQLLKAIQYLHGNSIVHRDLKPENVLLSQTNIKVSDFGISRFFSAKTFDDNACEYVEDYMGTFAGTPYWIAPEVFYRKYTESADIFSLGILFCAILTQDFIVYENSKYYGAFINYGMHGNRIGIGVAMYEKKKTLHPTYSPLQNDKHQYIMKNVVYEMLCFEPGKRLSLKNALLRINKISKRPKNAQSLFSSKELGRETLLYSNNVELESPTLQNNMVESHRDQSNFGINGCTTRNIGKSCDKKDANSLLQKDPGRKVQSLLSDINLENSSALPNEWITNIDSYSDQSNFGKNENSTQRISKSFNETDDELVTRFKIRNFEVLVSYIKALLNRFRRIKDCVQLFILVVAIVFLTCIYFIKSLFRAALN